MLEVRLIIADAAPLITLAAAQSLAYLLYVDRPVLIPDAVFHEATAGAGKLGAEEIIAWYRAHMDRLRIEPTEVFDRAVRLQERQSGRLPRDLGERAALEVVRHTPLLDGPEDRAVLLVDDRDAERILITDPNRLILLTTFDFLRQLEMAKRIQSADAVLEAAEQRGRMPSRRDLWSDHDPETRKAVEAILSQVADR